jgi:hypothetical protein
LPLSTVQERDITIANITYTDWRNFSPAQQKIVQEAISKITEERRGMTKEERRKRANETSPWFREQFGRVYDGHFELGNEGIEIEENQEKSAGDRDGRMGPKRRATVNQEMDGEWKDEWESRREGSVQRRLLFSLRTIRHR